MSRSVRDMQKFIRSIALALVLASAFGAAADDKQDWVADAARGQKLSESLCASCHVVRPDQKRGAVAGLPSFRVMAKMPNMRIFSVLIAPHRPMPDMALTRKEIADIMAYIEDVRRKEAGQPTTKSTPRKKPIYPSPS